MKTVFALTSWGNAGVPWISQCINLHPSIHAWSCKNFAPHSLLKRELTPLEYLDSISRLGWSDYQACGDIHGVSPHELRALHEAFGNAFRGAHLVAHPVPRFAGSLAFSKAVGRDWKHKDFLANWRMNWNDPIAVKARRILGEGGDHVPPHYMMNINGVNTMLGTCDPLFKLENLMARDDEWDAMIRHLSGGGITDYGHTWRQFKDVYIGVAHEPFRLDSPISVWQGLPEPSREIFASMLTDEARRAFVALGYDMSFVPFS